MKLLVCGGRGFNDYQFLSERLNSLNTPHTPITMVIHGGASGADSLAHRWAKQHGIQPVECQALWDYYKKAAGHRRNANMLMLKPDAVAAFPGGAGTAGMVKMAKAVNITIYDFRENTDAD